MNIKVITLTQPWATLMDVGAKRIETRSWSTSYRGPLAIHAAKGFPREAFSICATQPFAGVLAERADILHPDGLPKGFILAMGELVRIERITADSLLPDQPERSFGDYSIGRYMWFFENVKSFIYPVQAKGKLSIWDFSTDAMYEDYKKRFEARLISRGWPVEMAKQEAGSADFDICDTDAESHADDCDSYAKEDSR